MIQDSQSKKLRETLKPQATRNNYHTKLNSNVVLVLSEAHMIDSRSGTYSMKIQQLCILWL